MRFAAIPAVAALLVGCTDADPAEPSFAYVAPPDHFYIEQPFVRDFSCGTFTLHFDGIESERNIGWYDQEGNLIEVKGLYRRDGTYTNLTTGESVPLKMVIRFTVNFGVEAVLESDNGLFARVKLDEPIRDVGRFLVFQETGEFVFRVGREDIGIENQIFPHVCEALA